MSRSRHASRRELLAAFLGAPFALSLGCSPEFPARLEGSIVGASDVFGHRLRDGWRPTPAADAWQRHRVVIVGGGMAGLAAGWRLLRAGFSDFVILELEAVAGGTARSGKADSGGYPWGAHYVPAPLANNRLLITLLDEMGLFEGRREDGTPIVAEEYLCRDPQERVFYRGRWYEGLYLHAGETAKDRAEMERFRAEIDQWAAWRDDRGQRAFTVPAEHGSEDATVTALDRLSMAEWLDQKGFTSPRLRWLVNYGCRDDYGCTIEQTSAWAGLFYHVARLSGPGAESQPLITWPEGNGRLVRHLADRLGDCVQAGWAACDLAPTETGVDITALSRTGESVRGIHADQVIFAAPQFMARYLIRPWRERPPAYLSAFEYSAWMVANLHLRDRPYGRGFPLAWDNVLYESPSLGYVVNTHQRGLDHGPTVFTYYYPLCDDDSRGARARLLATGWSDWAEVVLADLNRAHGDIREMAERLDVMRWGHAMVRPRPGFIWGSERRQASRPYRGIHFAAADLSGLALVEEALYHGVRAAEEVLGAQRRPVESLLGGTTS